jgi:hypothetical protein
MLENVSKGFCWYTNFINRSWNAILQKTGFYISHSYICIWHWQQLRPKSWSHDINLSVKSRRSLHQSINKDETVVLISVKTFLISPCWTVWPGVWLVDWSKRAKLSFIWVLLVMIWLSIFWMFSSLPGDGKKDCKDEYSLQFKLVWWDLRMSHITTLTESWGDPRSFCTVGSFLFYASGCVLCKLCGFGN